jgi:hypothetical protein
LYIQARNWKTFIFSPCYNILETNVTLWKLSKLQKVFAFLNLFLTNFYNANFEKQCTIMMNYLVDHLCKYIECIILLCWGPLLPFINLTWVDCKSKLFACLFCFDLLRCQYCNILPINVHPLANLPKFRLKLTSKDQCWVGGTCI